MNGLKTIVDVLKNSINVENDFVGYIAGNESIDAVTMPVVESKKSDIQASIEAAFSEIELTLGAEEFKLEPYQIESAKIVALHAVDPLNTLKRFSEKGREQIIGVGESLTIDTERYLDDVIPQGELLAGTEAFDGQDLSASMYFSVVFNSLTIKQDAVSELFYPIVVVDSNKAGATVTAKITNIMSTIKRDVSGRPVDFKRESIIKKLNDTALFTLDANRLYPVYSTDSADRLLDIPGGKREVEVVDGYKITTAPIKTNEKIDLLGISQTDEMVAKGIMDETDALNGHIAIENLYFKITGNDADGNSVTEYHMKSIKGLPAVFTYTPTGHSKDLQLDYKTDSIAWVGGSITKADGTPTAIADLANLTAGYSVKLKINLKGDANAQEGTVAVYPVEVTLAGVLDANGNALAEDDATYVSIKDVFDTIGLSGCDIEAYASNTNARFRGKLLTTDTYTNVYTIPTRVKVREVTSVYKNGDDADTAGLIGQIEFNKRALSKFGLLELNNTANVLENLSDDTESFGISNKLVNKKCIRESINLSNLVNSLRSGERVIDIVEALKLKIRNTALDLYIGSNYNLAFESLYPNVKPTVIIGTDVNVGRFLTSFEDELFRYQVSVSNDTLVANKIFVSFGVMGASRNKEANLLNFGVCFWSPEVVLTLQRQEKGTVKQETISMPRFIHQTIMPVLGVLEVSGLDEVSGNLPQYVHNV